MKKKGLRLWLGIFVVFVLGVVWYGAANIILCWDGIEVDETLLMEKCGITREEYFASPDIHETCPEALDAVYMVGGCETDWPSVAGVTGAAAAVYLALSGVGVGLLRLLRRQQKNLK